MLKAGSDTPSDGSCFGGYILMVVIVMLHFCYNCFMMYDFTVYFYHFKFYSTVTNFNFEKKYLKVFVKKNVKRLKCLEDNFKKSEYNHYKIKLKKTDKMLKVYPIK